MNDNPYAAPTTDSKPIPMLGSGPILATRSNRFVAALVDGLLAGGLMWSFLYFILGITFRDVAKMSWLQQLEMNAAGILIFLLLHSYLLAKYGQTIGKKLVGIRIVKVNNAAAAFPHLILKRYVPEWLLVLVPVVGPYLNLINILLIFRSDRRCGHDLIAGTKVIRVQTSAETPFGTIAASEGSAAAKT